MQMPLVRDDSCDPDWIFVIFHLFSLFDARSCDWYGLFSFWRESSGHMLCRWNGELFNAIFLLVFHLFLLSSSLSLYWSCVILLQSTYSEGHASSSVDLLFLAGLMKYEPLCFLNHLNLFEDSIPSAHHPRPQVPRLTGICWVWARVFKLSSLVYLRDLCKHTQLLPHADPAHMQWSVLPSICSSLSLFLSFASGPYCSSSCVVLTKWN